MNKRKWKVLGAFFATLLVSIVGMMILLNMGEKKEPPKIEKLKRAVKTVEVKYGEITTNITAPGRVQSLQKVDVISEVSGKILPGDVVFKKGEKIKKGDVLVRIYANDFVYSLQSRKSRFLNLVASILPDLRIDFPDSYQKWDSFFLQVEIDQNIPDLPKINDPKEKIFVASKNILSEYYGIKGDEERLIKYTIYAPFNGYITNALLEVGSVANMGSRLGQIIKTGKLELEVPVATRDAGLISTGNNAIINNNQGDAIAEGIVTRKAGYIDPETQSLSVFVSVTKNSGDLYEGQYYQVVFPSKTFQQALEVPRNVVFNTNEVFLVDSGFLKKATVNILKINDKTLLLDGLKEGLTLVSEPLINVKEGTEVTISTRMIDSKSISEIQ